MSSFSRTGWKPYKIETPVLHGACLPNAALRCSRSLRGIMRARLYLPVRVFDKKFGSYPDKSGPSPCRIYKGRPTVGRRGGSSFPQNAPPAPPTPGIFTTQGCRTPPPFLGSLPRPGDLHYPEAFVRGGAPGDLHYPRSGTLPRPPSSHPPFPPGFICFMVYHVLLVLSLPGILVYPGVSVLPFP